MASYTEKQYSAAALLLAETYGEMLKERDNLKRMLDGSLYTEDMAISELQSVTVNYEIERVQSSNTTNAPERIAVKLSDGYMERRRAELRHNAAELTDYLAYLEWKIGIVEVAMRERMTRLQRGIVKQYYLLHKTYRQMKESYKGARLHNQTISVEKKITLEMIAMEIKTASLNDNGEYVHKLMEEVEKGYVC